MTPTSTTPPPAAGDDPRALCGCGDTYLFHSGKRGGPQACFRCPCENFSPAASVQEVVDPDKLRAMAVRLWDLLDQIDTASDMAKADDKAYRAMVETLQARRREVMVSDGYRLFVRTA